MGQKYLGLLGLGVGASLIVIYSVVMIVNAGSTGWAWVLLVGGVGAIVGGAYTGSRTERPT